MVFFGLSLELIFEDLNLLVKLVDFIFIVQVQDLVVGNELV
jgi:hypothetical protein